MIAIVEGMDRCGKDTLIKHIRNNIITNPYTTCIHCNNTPSSIDDKLFWSKQHYLYILSLCRMFSNNGDNVILNRSHLGEDVYGPIFRNINADFIYDLERQLLSDILESVYLIVLVDDIESVLSREDGQSPYKDIATAQKVYDRFKIIYNKTLITNKMIYNISENNGWDNLNITVDGFLLNEHK